MKHHNKHLQKQKWKEAKKVAQEEKEITPEEASYRSLAVIANTVDLLQKAAFTISEHRSVATSLDFLEAMHNNLLTDCRANKIFMKKYPQLAEKKAEEKAESD